MLFKQEDLVSNPLMEAANILNESVYLDESESMLSPTAIPVVENSRIGANVVAFEDIDRLTEENGIDYFDAMEAIAEANDIDPKNLAVAVPEWKIIENPGIVNEMANVVIKPMSEHDPMMEMAGVAVKASLDGDDSLLEDYTNFDFEPLLEKTVIYLNSKGKKVGEKTIAGDDGRVEYVKNGKVLKSKTNDKKRQSEMTFNTGRDESDYDPQHPTGAQQKYVDQTIQANEALKKALADAKTNRPNIIARAIGSLRAWAAKLEQNHSEKNKGVINALLRKIGAAIRFLTDKLSRGKATEWNDRNNKYKDLKAKATAAGIK